MEGRSAALARAPDSLGMHPQLPSCTKMSQKGHIRGPTQWGGSRCRRRIALQIQLRIMSRWKGRSADDPTAYRGCRDSAILLRALVKLVQNATHRQGSRMCQALNLCMAKESLTLKENMSAINGKLPVKR